MADGRPAGVDGITTRDGSVTVSTAPGKSAEYEVQRAIGARPCDAAAWGRAVLNVDERAPRRQGQVLDGVPRDAKIGRPRRRHKARPIHGPPGREGARKVP